MHLMAYHIVTQKLLYYTQGNQKMSMTHCQVERMDYKSLGKHHPNS